MFMWLFFEGRPQRMLVALLVIILVILSVVGIVNATSESEVKADYNPQSRVMADFLLMTNALRRGNGLAELKASEELEKSATAKLANMQKNGYWGHYGPNNETFSDLVWEFKTDSTMAGENLARCFNNETFSDLVWEFKTDSTMAGENLARCFNNHDDAFKALVKSPTHFKVLTTPEFDELGVASFTNNKGCESIVMHFSN